MGNSSSDNIKNPILKKAIRISDTMVIVPIHESIAKEQQIDEETWFEQISTNGGIFLKISSMKVGPHTVEASRV